MVVRAFLALYLLLAFVLSGCESDRTSIVSTEEQQGTEWAVLIYANGNYAGDVLAEPIEGTLSRAVSSMRVIENTYAPSSIETFVCLSSSETNGAALIYRIKSSGSLSGTPTPELISTLENANMAQPSTLSDFFDVSLSRTEGQRFALCLSGSGAGWLGMLGNDQLPEGMGLVDLRSTLENAAARLPLGQFDLLALYAPGMSNIETIVELSHTSLYIASSPWQQEQPHSLSIERWYRDLAVDPTLDPSDLGAYVIDAERLAQDTTDVELFSNLWECGKLNEVENAFNRFATVWCEFAPQHSATITNLRITSRDDEHYDETVVDLARYADGIAESPEFSDSSFAPLVSAATELRSAIQSANVARFGSTESHQYGGMNLYLPLGGEVGPLDAAHYQDLRICAVAPHWANVIDSLANRGSSTVTISGQAFWPGNEFYNVYFYADTVIGGAFGVYTFAEPEWTFTNETHDTISFTAEFDLLSADSMQIEFGLFIDHEDNGLFNTGDSLGGWRTGSSNFTPFWVYRGTEDNTREVTIRLRRP